MPWGLIPVEPVNALVFKIVKRKISAAAKKNTRLVLCRMDPNRITDRRSDNARLKEEAWHDYVVDVIEISSQGQQLGTLASRERQIVCQLARIHQLSYLAIQDELGEMACAFSTVPPFCR